MFCITFWRVRLGVSFSFFALAALLLLRGTPPAQLAAALLSCLCHEMGHLLFMLIFRRRPESIILYGGGIRIVPPRTPKPLSLGREAAILLGGCGVNFLLWGLFTIAGAEFFAQVNLMLGAFNLLPFSCLDGGRALALLTNGRGTDIVRAVFILLIAALLSISLLRGIFSPSFTVTFFCIAFYELLAEAEK